MDIPNKILLMLRNHVESCLSEHAPVKGVNDDIGLQFSLKWDKGRPAQKCSLDKSGVFTGDRSTVIGSTKGLRDNAQLRPGLKSTEGGGFMSHKYNNYRLALLTRLRDLPFSSAANEKTPNPVWRVFEDIRSNGLSDKVVLWCKVFASLRNNLSLTLNKNTQYIDFSLIGAYVFNYNLIALNDNLTYYMRSLSKSPLPTKSFLIEGIIGITEFIDILIELTGLIDEHLTEFNRMTTLQFFGKETK